MIEIVLLTGPTSAVTSTIGHFLLAALGGRTVWIEADRCFPGLSPSQAGSLRDTSGKSRMPGRASPTSIWGVAPIG
jgi:hypothetical protein